MTLAIVCFVSFLILMKPLVQRGVEAWCKRDERRVNVCVGLVHVCLFVALWVVTGLMCVNCCFDDR